MSRPVLSPRVAAPWRRRRAAERKMRRLIGMPLNHPERIADSDTAAEQGDFPAWAAELADAGLAAGDIILDERRSSDG
jgi:hypothetical protein